MNREEALQLLKQKLSNKNLIKHSLAVEAAMRGLAGHFEKDPEKWGVCGLLHDVDYDQTKDDMELHSKKGAEILKEKGLELEVCEAVLTHNEAHGIEPKTLMGKALFCVDPLTGLIVAATLVLPSKKINDLETENVLNRFKEGAFARGANREIIGQCEPYLGLSLEDFVDIVLSSMKNISSDLGL
ncbi:MAG: HD domain-containing protein [Candidatus Nealsonbacteria bacterium]|nr:HD domain-containing protein [Candidatus Nealsonbacteria bacterium]